MESKLTLEQRVAKLEALVNILIEERYELRARLSEVSHVYLRDKYNDEMIERWNNHPDGDFDRTVCFKGITMADTSYRDKHLTVVKNRNSEQA